MSNERRTPVHNSGVSLSYAWYAVAILTLANMSGFVDRQILSYLVVPMKRDLGVSDTQMSLLMGLGFVLFYSVLGIPIGRLVDRGRRKIIVAVGVALWSVMTTATGLARSFSGLMAARVGVGVGEATLLPSGVSMIADMFPRRVLGIAMSVFATGTFFGSGVGYALGAYVVHEMERIGTVTLPIVGTMHAWQTVFFMVGLPGFLIALLALTMREPARQRDTAVTDATSADTVGATVPVIDHPNGDSRKESSSWSAAARGESQVHSRENVHSRPADVKNASLREVFAYMRRHSRTFVAVTFGFACSAAVNYGIGAWMGSFFMRTHHWTDIQAGTWQGINTIIFGPIGTLLGGRIADAWTKRGITDAPLRVGMLAALGMIVTAGVYPSVSWDKLAAALIIPVNIFAAMPWGAASVAIAEIMPPRMRGQGIAINQLVLNLVAGILGPTSVAVLTDYVFHNDADLRWSLMICAIGGMALTIGVLNAGRAAYRVTVAERGGS